METFKLSQNLVLRLECDRQGQTIVAHRYAAYPLGISRTFRRDTIHPNRAYLYLTNTSPGLLAGDRWQISLQLAANTNLYLTDQAATKVHCMPMAGTKATLDYEIEIGEGATLEFVPEPIILFRDATLEQTICIKCHPTGKLFWSEIIVPGRLARGEFYEFNAYRSRLQVTSPDGELWFNDATRLEGKLNPFKNSHLFASAPIIGNFITILPDSDLSLLSDRLAVQQATNCPGVTAATSILPHHKGLLIRAIARGTHGLKNYLQYTLTMINEQERQEAIDTFVIDNSHDQRSIPDYPFPITND